VTHPRHGVSGALLQQRLKAQGPRLERAAVEEGVEGEEGFGVVRLDECGQIDLVEAALLVGGVLVVQPPQPAIGQDAPLHAAVLDGERDLIDRVLIGECIDVRALEVLVERALPVFGVADRECFALE
jgi:hypothetical protein